MDRTIDEMLLDLEYVEEVINTPMISLSDHALDVEKLKKIRDAIRKRLELAELIEVVE